MRNLTPSSLAKIAQQNGAEPITLVGVNWAGVEILYCDRTINPEILGKVLKVQNIESAVSLDGTGGNVGLTVLFDDTDGSLKRIFDSVPIHHRPVTVYQWFADIPISEMFALYSGVIQSPIIFNDNDRTLSITVNSVNEHQEIGFAPEEGQFPNLPIDTIGKAWPYCFGNPRHVPGLTYQYVPVGTILFPYFVIDPKLDNGPATQGATSGTNIGDADKGGNDGMGNYYQYTRAVPRGSKSNSPYDFDIPNFDAFGDVPPAGTKSFFIGDEEYDEHDYTSEVIQGDRNGNPAGEDADKTKNNVVAPSNGVAAPQPSQSSYYYHAKGVAEELAAKGARSDGVYLLNGGLGFPVGIDVEVSMNNHLFAANLDINGFMRLKQLRLPYAVAAYYVGDNKPLEQGESVADWQNERMQNTVYYTADGTIPYLDYYFNPAYKPHLDSSGQVSLGYKLQQGLQSDGFQVYQAGSQLRPMGDFPVDYIINIVPCIVEQVWGFKSLGNTKTLVPVPLDRWEHVEVNFGTVTAQIVRLKRLLSMYPGENWEDGIYVDLMSSTGPNPVDIMKDIINVYCPDMTYDAASFNAVRPLLANFPMNFYLSDKPEVLNFLQDIAYQCRCAIFVKKRVFYLKYLAYEPAAVDIVGIDDIIEGSIEISITETESLVTRLVGNYKPDYAYDETYKVIKRNNIPRYGLFKDEHEFSAYQNIVSVQQTVNYWIIIRSNIWKKIKFSTPLTKLNLETFDNIIINLPGILANVPVNCRIEATTYDPEENKIDFECWTPVRQGEMLPYPLAYPADSETDFNQLRLQEFDADPYRDFRVVNVGIVATVGNQQTNNPSSPAGRDTLDDADKVGYDTELGGSADKSKQFRGISGYQTDNPGAANDANPGPAPFRPEPILAPNLALLGDQSKLEYGARKEPIDDPAKTDPKDVENKTLKNGKLLQTPTPSAIPGKVISGSGTDYRVEIWPSGMDQESIKVEVKQLDIDPNETIPAGTSVLVSRVCTGKTSDGGSATTTTFEYTMQVPVWLE